MSTSLYPSSFPIPHSLAAIILAGGQSSRMGQDKALMLVEEIPLLRRVCEVALQCVPMVYVVTPWPDRYRAILPMGCQLVQEQTYGTTPHGPLMGFAQGLAQVSANTSAEWVLLLACDLPRLQSPVLQQWMQELSRAGQEVAFLPRGQKGWEPLCGFYRVSCLSRLQAAIARGDRSFQRWLSQELVKELPVDHPTVLFNCNTPDDWANLANF